MAIDWTNPTQVQQFRSDAIGKGIGGASQVDQFIAQQQAAALQSSGQQITGMVGQNQGGAITPDQALQNPNGALNFLKAGGQLSNTGPGAQQAFIADAQKKLDKAKGKNGYVDPQIYNQLKDQFAATGGDAGAFDNKFQDNYVNPKNVFYNTQDAKLARSALPVVKNVVDSYFQLKDTGQGWQTLANLPGPLGDFFKKNRLAPEEAHNSFLMGQTGNIRAIAGAGQGQGFRFNLQELNNIAGLLPDGYDTKSQSNAKLDRLNEFLKSNMGTDLTKVMKGNY